MHTFWKNLAKEIGVYKVDNFIKYSYLYIVSLNTLCTVKYILYLIILVNLYFVHK